MSGHLGDEAELFPLGVLDGDASREVLRHIAGCDACAARVAAAQRVAGSLAAALPAPDPPARLERRIRDAAGALAVRRVWDPRIAALAAALVLALAGAGWQTLRINRATAAHELVLATIVHSHFRHVSMTSQLPEPFGAKVLYAPDGSWIYVAADHPAGALHAVGRSAHGAIELGALQAEGASATLLVRPRERIDAIELRSGDATAAAANLAY
jgi:hypothetical protein